MALKGSLPRTAGRNNVVIPGHSEGRLPGTHFLTTDCICTSAIFVRLTSKSSEVYDHLCVFVLAKTRQSGWSPGHAERCPYVKPLHRVPAASLRFLQERQLVLAWVSKPISPFLYENAHCFQRTFLTWQNILFSSPWHLNMYYLENVRRSESQVFILNALPPGEKKGSERRSVYIVTDVECKDCLLSFGPYRVKRNIVQ